MTQETVSYLSLVLAVLGIPTAYVFARYFARRPSLKYTIQSEKIFDDLESQSPGNISISYNDITIRNFHRWKVGIWNSGNAHFDDASFLDEDPISFLFQGHKIIDVQLRLLSRDVVAPTFSIEGDDRLRPHFNICDQSDAFVFFVFTEASQDTEEGVKKAKTKVKVTGSLRGLPKGPSEAFAPSDQRGLSYLAPLFVGSFIFVMPFLIYLQPDFPPFAYFVDQDGGYLGRADGTLELVWRWASTIFVSVGLLLFQLFGLLIVTLFTHEWLRLPNVIREGFQNRRERSPSKN